MAFNWRFRDAARLTAPTLVVSMLLLGAVHAQEPIEPEPFDPTVPFDPGVPVDPMAPDTIEPDPDAMEEPAPDTMEPAPDAAQPAPDAVEPAPAVPAKPIKNPIAEFAGIDKITGRIITFDVYIDETVQFGALQVTPRICYSRPQTEETRRRWASPWSLTLKSRSLGQRALASPITTRAVRGCAISLPSSTRTPPRPRAGP